MTRRQALLTTLVCALFFGLASGYAEWLTRLLLPWAPPYRIRLGGYLAWMPATANAILLLSVALGVAVVAIWRPSLATRERLVFVFGAPAFVNVTALLNPPLALWAAVLLAIGLAAVAAQNAERVLAIARRAWLPLAVGVVVIGLGVEWSRWATLREARAAARPDEVPHVFLLVLDNVRAPNLSAYGYFRRTTPALEDLAAEGAAFERAYSTSSWSLPSHSSIMTGRWAHEMAADWKVPLGGEFPTLAEVLAEQGYLTAGFVSNGAYTQREAGMSRGFAYYEDYPLSMRQLLMSSKLGNRVVTLWDDYVVSPNGPVSRIYHRRSAAELHDRVLRWLDRNPGHPAFVFVNYFDAHVEYYWPEGTEISPLDVPPQPAEPTLTIPFAPHPDLEPYDRAIAGMDRELGRFFDELRSRGILDRSIVIVTSDHGEEFDEHGVFGHGNTLYSAGLQVPIIVRYPAAVPPGARPTTPVSIRDIPATVLDLAGVGADRMPGCSLARLWAPGDSGPARPEPVMTALRQGINTPPEYPVSRGDMMSVLDGALHLIVNGDGELELYDVLADPWEQHDLSGDPAYAGELSRLQAIAGDPPTSGACLATP